MKTDVFTVKSMDWLGFMATRKSMRINKWKRQKNVEQAGFVKCDVCGEFTDDYAYSAFYKGIVECRKCAAGIKPNDSAQPPGA